jgi:electron-transferring-flavoprotein dehydrogenase
MASKNTVLPLLRRELRSSTRFPRTSSISAIATPARQSAPFTAFGAWLARRTVLFTPLTQTRAFSQSLSKRFTDENGDFDPRSLDRESDDVDVCIVGGGMLVSSWLL